jgi:protein ImuB
MDTPLPPIPPAMHATGGSPPPRISAILVEPFALWLAEWRNPELVRTPLVACEEGRVLHANASARRHGIARGMRLAGARLRATSLAVALHDEPSLQQAWQSFGHDLYQLTPWLDARHPGRAFARLDEAEAHGLARHLHARVGLADDLESATLAALAARPGEVRTLPPKGGEAFLARLPLRFLRGVGLGEGDLTRLHWLGLQHVADLASWSASQIRAYLGPNADPLLPYLHGPRHTDLQPWTPPTVLRRTAIFEQPLFEPADLDPAIDRLSRSLALALRGRAASLVGVVATHKEGVAQRARRAKEPLQNAGRIRQQAWFALRESGAAERGIERLSIELSNPERQSRSIGLWPQRAQREVALTALLERYPETLVAPQALDPYAPIASMAGSWGPLHEPSTAHRAGPERRKGPGGRTRSHPIAHLLEPASGSVPPQTLYTAPPLADGLPTTPAGGPNGGPLGPQGEPTPSRQHARTPFERA